MAVTRADVAKRAGVSPAVVSYVLNPGTRPVAAATRERVLAAVNELGYRPNAVAQALRSGPTQSIGLLVPDLTNPFFAEVAREVEAIAFEHGYVLLVGSTGGEADREVKYIHSFVDRQVDALILVTSQALSVLETTAALGTPAVTLDRVPEGSPVSSVTADNVGGAHSAVAHLLDLGHTRIGMLGGPEGLHVADDRVRGWRDALHAAGVRSVKGDLMRSTFTRAGGEGAARDLLRRRDLTAVFASSDVQAVGLLAGCAAMGIDVPNDLSVVAFDGTELARFASPPLTTVQQPIRELAETAMRLVLARIDDPNSSPPSRVLPTKLVVRASTAAPPHPPAQ